MSATDKIIISKLALSARIGLTEAERSFPQRVLLSAEIFFCSREAASSKRIADTVCYDTLASEYQQHVIQKDWVLVEELLEELAEVTLAHPKAEAVTLRLEKFVLASAASVAVEISRSKAEAV